MTTKQLGSSQGAVRIHCASRPSIREFSPRSLSHDKDFENFECHSKRPLGTKVHLSVDSWLVKEDLADLSEFVIQFDSLSDLAAALEDLRPFDIVQKLHLEGRDLPRATKLFQALRRLKESGSLPAQADQVAEASTNQFAEAVKRHLSDSKINICLRTLDTVLYDGKSAQRLLPSDDNKGVIPTQSRNEIERWAAKRLQQILQARSSNRDTCKILLGSGANGNSFFARSLINALHILHPDSLVCWLSFKKGRRPRLPSRLSESTTLLLGLEELSDLCRKKSEEDVACWLDVMGLMKRDRTICIVSSADSWKVNYLASPFCPALNTTVVSFEFIQPLDRGDYVDFLTCLGVEKYHARSICVLHYFTGGKLGLLMNLRSSGIYTDDLLSDPSALRDKLATELEFLKLRPSQSDNELSLMTKKKLHGSSAIEFTLNVFRLPWFSRSKEIERRGLDWANSLRNIVVREDEFQEQNFKLAMPWLMEH